MWVTQTYLGGLEPAAKVFVYHLFEDCGPEQTTFTTRVQSHLDIFDSLVGTRGFEPPTLCSQSRCSTRLSYVPTGPGMVAGSLPGATKCAKCDRNSCQIMALRRPLLHLDLNAGVFESKTARVRRC
jgi:hypothetical protein